ncbi:MAG: hypothetical protein QM776_17795 [Rhodocyclaceae bacterium]
MSSLSRRFSRLARSVTASIAAPLKTSRSFSLTILFWIGLQVVALLAVSLWLSPPRAKPLRSQAFEKFEAGAEINRALFVVAPRVYDFNLRISLGAGASQQAAARDMLKALGRHNLPVARAASATASQAVSLHVRIHAAESVGQHPLTDRVVRPWRTVSASKDHLTLHIGTVELQPGYYRLSVAALNIPPVLATARVSLETQWEPVATRKRQQRMPDSIAALLPLLDRERILDMAIEEDFSQQHALQSAARLRGMDRGFWHMDSYSIPRSSGVLHACDYQARFHRDTGNFWLIRRCDGQSTTAYQGVLAEWQAPVMAQRPLLRF